MKTNQSWGGRFSQGPKEAVAQYTDSQRYDRTLYAQDIRASQAHARMLGRQGVISPAEADTLVRGLDDVRAEIEAGSFVWKPELEDVHMNIEARLTDVRYELENHASQLRLYDNQIDYATIYLYIDEVQEYTPVEEPTFFERIQNSFSNSLEGLGNGIVDITVFLVGNSPYLLVFGIAGFVILKLVKRPGKLRFRKKVKKEEQK